MSQTTYARHLITRQAQTGHFDQDYRIPFSPWSYSRFKYGSKSTAREFGFELASGLLGSDLFTSLLPRLRARAGIIYPAPYKFIPTATKALQDYFMHRFNSVAVNEYGILPLREDKVYRNHSYQVEYGNMSKTNREAAISGDDFRISTDQINADELLLFLDDIRITGAHEDRMTHMIRSSGLPNDHVFLYFARVTEPEQTDPRLENFLNGAALNGLLSINQIIQNDKFLFNTRVVKFMLSASTDEFRTFIQYQSDVFQSTLLSYATGNGYGSQSAFLLNYQFLYNLTGHAVPA